MKTTPPSQPRLFCRVVRQWSSVVAGGGTRHLGSCADCRAYFESADALETSLRRDAPAWAQATPEPSAGFEQRVLNAVTPATEPAAAARRHPWRGAWAVAGALAVVAAIGFYRPVAGPVRPATADDAAMLAGVVREVSRGLVENVIPATGALVADNSLQREFDAIYADARSALGFLALNFLPTATNGASPAPARPI